eukprot:1517276-Prymnesium_polylepis.3
MREECLRAFCAAPADVRAVLLDTCATIMVPKDSDMYRESLQATRRLAEHAWAREHPPGVVLRGLLAFLLNGHTFGDKTTAIFSLGVRHATPFHQDTHAHSHSHAHSHRHTRTRAQLARCRRITH